MVSVAQQAGAADAPAAVRFQYRRLYSDQKRPVGGIAFEAELAMQFEEPRVVWLQQWIAGAFDYMDNSVGLAASHARAHAARALRTPRAVRGRCLPSPTPPPTLGCPVWRAADFGRCRPWCV